MRFISKGIGAQEFFTFLLPTENGFTAPEVFETEVSGGRAFVVNFRGFQDLFVFADGEQIVRTEIFNTNFRFLWARLSAGARRAEPGRYARVLLRRGHELIAATGAVTPSGIPVPEDKVRRVLEGNKRSGRQSGQGGPRGGGPRGPRQGGGSRSFRDDRSGGSRGERGSYSRAARG